MEREDYTPVIEVRYESIIENSTMHSYMIRVMKTIRVTRTSWLGGYGK